MLTIDRHCAGQFRSAARKCVLGRPKGPAPPVVLEQTREHSHLICDFGEVALALRQPGSGGPAARIAVPGSLLEELESSKGEAGVIESGPEFMHCTWHEGESPRQSTWTPIETPAKLSVPSTFEHLGREFLEAMLECGRCTARDSMKFALTRIQLQGQHGRVVGSDGRHLLIWNGFRFPFPESLLVPAVPVFGFRAVSTAAEVRVGRTKSHFVAIAGPWTIWLQIIDGRFPNVAQVIPASSEHTILLGEGDLRPALEFCDRAIVPDDGDPASVTVDFGNPPAMRARTEAAARSSELTLPGSRAKGKPVSLVLNRDHLQRALRMSFRFFRTPSENGPVVFEDERRVYVSTTFLPSRAVPPLRPAEDTAPRVPEQPHEVIPISQGVHSMASETNGRNHAAEENVEALNFLAEAEELRDALYDVGRRAGRLVSALKQLQKQRRVLETAWSSLKNLRLGS